MRFRFIEDHRRVWPVRMMCGALSISPSGYYAWQSSAASRARCEGRLGWHVRRSGPFIATALFAAYGTGYAIASYLLACAVITIIATAMMTDYTGKDIEGEYA
jgi:hypothetical protein